MISIIEAVATINERRILMDFLDQLRDKSFTINFDVKSFLNLAPKPALEIINTQFLSAFSQGMDAFHKEIDKAQKELKDIQVVTLTIAIEPEDRLAWNIKKWFKDELGRDVLIRFERDKNLIGGALVEGNGIRTEFSFRDFFERKEKN